MKALRWRLFPKYATLIIALVSGMLAASGAVGIYFSHRENQEHLVALQAEKAQGAATRIEQYVQDIEHQLSWTALPRVDVGDAGEARRIEYLKLLRQAPPITELVWIDASGREQLRVSRLAMDELGSAADVSGEPKFRSAIAGKTYFGPVYFRKGTEPYMTIARPAGSGGGVTAAEVNLKFVWEVVSRIRIGAKGLAYVVDADGTLIAHPDISLVLKKTDMKALPQVAALARPDGDGALAAARDLAGQPVLAAHTRIPALAWTVFVEAPRAEAFAPLYATLRRMGLVFAAAMLVSIAASFFLARALVRPLRALQEGAAQIGAGELDRRIEVRTGDELEGLAEQFNKMSVDLQASYAGLERKVEERTLELTESLDHQTAIADILRVISASPTDTQPVFDSIVKSCQRLFQGRAVAFALPRGEMIEVVAFADDGTRGERTGGFLEPWPLDHGSAAGACILDARIINVADIEEAVTEFPRARNLALALGYRSGLFVPLLRDDRAAGAIAILRATRGAFTPQQVALATTFADQAVIAIENVRLFNETREALDRQTATAEVLQVISSSVANTEPVFEKILDSCRRVFDIEQAGIALIGDDGLVRLGAHTGGGVVARDAVAAFYPVPVRKSMQGYAIHKRQVLHYLSALRDAKVPWSLRELAQRYGDYSVLVAPMLWEDRGVGAIHVTRTPPVGFTDPEIALLKTFADQAVIAIQNAKLFNETRDALHKVEQRTAELTEALDYQTAISEVLRVISQSPTDVAPVFEAILDSATRLFGGPMMAIFRYDGRLLHQVAVRNWPAEAVEDARRFYPGPPSPHMMSGRIILSGELQVQEDTFNDPNYDQTTAHLGLWRRMLGAPLLKDGAPVGAIVLAWPDPGKAPPRQVELLKTFADQAVIAIENVRLFNETKEALEQQTATAEILQVISGSPTDVQPVFDAIAERAMALCDARFGAVVRLEGERIHMVAFHGASQEASDTMRAAFPMKLGRGAITARAILERVPVQVADVLADPEFALKDAARRAGYRAIMAVPMLREGQVSGSIAVCREEPGLFPDRLVRLLQTFADQAVIAIENVRLFNETKEALEQQRASAEVLSVISSSVADTMPVFEKILASCQRIFEGDELGTVLVGDDGQLRLGAALSRSGAARDVAFTRPLANSATELAIRERRVLHYPDVFDADDVPQSLRAMCERQGTRSILLAPMFWEGRGVGSIFVARVQARVFSDKEIALLKTFADQAVIAIQNARLFDEIQAKGRELEQANRHKSEFLANMSHELRTPLNAIIGFSEVLSEQMFGALNDKQLEYLQDIHTSGHHLLTLINDILDLSKIEAGRMELDLTRFDLALLLDNTTTLVRERALRQGLTLTLEVEAGLGDWVADARKLKQVVINLLSNAVKFTPAGGRVTLRARALEHAVEIAVADTGVGIAADQQALVFEEFRQAGGDYLRKAEGTGLGLALAKRFVELHGGTMRVESVPGHGSTFAFILPERVLEAAS